MTDTTTDRDDTDEQQGETTQADESATVSQDEADIEADREQRLAAENRPENVEVDNTQRTFDTDSGLFTDNEEYDEAEQPFAGDETV